MSLVLVELRFPGKEDAFGERLYWKKVDPLPEPRADNNARACSDCFALTDMTRLGRKRRVTLPVEPTFYFSCKRVTKFWNEKLEKVGVKLAPEERRANKKIVLTRKNLLLLKQGSMFTISTQ